MKLLSIVFSVIILSSSVFAEEFEVAAITADIDPQVATLKIEVANGGIHSMRVISKLGNQVVGDDSFPVESLDSHEGVTTSERSGHRIVVLRSESFNPRVGGTVIVDYLYNGITRRRKQLKLKFMNENGTFKLRKEDGREVNHLHFVGNRWLRRVVGLKSIDASFR
jgi:hypothetical protein